jgi:holo-[acyl-carrier protein] synthase
MAGNSLKLAEWSATGRLGVGVDLVEIARIEKFWKKWGERGVKKFLTPGEIQIASRPSTIAGFFAGKEAFSKAVGTGIGAHLSFLDLEIAKTPTGQPFFRPNPPIWEKFQIEEVHLSISHDAGIAIAMVVILKKG